MRTQNTDTAVKEYLPYFDEFAWALATYLRPYKDDLGDSFFGIAQHELSILVSRTEGGLCARVIGKWLGSRVRIWCPRDRAEQETCRFSGSVREGRSASFSVLIKRTDVSSDVAIGLRFEGRRPIATLASDGKAGQLMVAPSLTCESECTSCPLTAAWLVQWNSPAPPAEPLDGLDPDPKIAAHGVAEALLRLAGIRKLDPRKRFEEAREALLGALQTVSAFNEDAIHRVIERYPWIVAYEHEFKDVRSKPHLRYEEIDGHGASTRHTIIPDFVYLMHDGSVICVEIESGNKRLFVTANETGFGLRSNRFVRAEFQISNYRQIFERYGAKEICEQLRIPTVTLFRYLLIAGTRTQVDFDARSWNNLRRQLNDQRIEMQTWDHYISLLERQAKACDFSAPGSNDQSSTR